MSKKLEFCSLLMSDLYLFFYCIFSRPLYLCYFIFFSPFILRLISFLSPLLVTTSLLLLALFTTFSHDKFKLFPDQSCGPSILLSVYQSILEMLKSLGDAQNEHHLEDFEVYKMVFQETPIEFLDYTSVEGIEKSVLDPPVQEKDPATATIDVENSGEMEEKKLTDVLKELDEFESSIWSDSVETEKLESLGTKVDKAVGRQKEEMIMGNGSKEGNADKVKKSYSLGDNLDYNNSQDFDYNLGSYGSMRKEKEWKRTLACKLYEERHNNNDSSGEGMDLLWETYEVDAAKSKMKKEKTTKKKTKKKGESKRYQQEEEEDEDMNDQLCCLQALKFSTGKMNLGMGKPNLVKISKAIRGFGWLHHVSKKNKVHCGDR